ncbi:unnamed protein product, partial [Rotaria magnacalcarata]
KQLRIVCGTTSPQHSKLNDLNEQLTYVSSKVNGHQNGFHEPNGRHKPSSVSVGNSRDSMSKQQMSNTSKSGPTKRTHGIVSCLINKINRGFLIHTLKLYIHS